MRIAIADPPYPGMAKKHYGDHPDYAGEVDHVELLERLERAYDGWVLHTHSPALRLLIPLLPADARIMAWCKSFATFKRNVPVAYAWEPVIVKACRKPIVSGRIIMRDYIVAPVVINGGAFVGAKPEAVCRWAFEVVGAEPTDELHDLYPGTGAVTEAWNKWRSELRLEVS
jgi:hypothetical protein